MSDSKTLLKLLILHLQSDAPSAPVLKIVLAAEAARPRVSQGGLFSPLCPDPEKVELTVARLANLVGDSNLGSPELLDTHRPEGFRMRRFVPNRDPADTRRPIRRSPQGQDGVVCRRAERSPTHQSRSGDGARSALGRAPLAPTLGNLVEKDFQTAFRVFRPALPGRVEVRKGCPARVAFPGIRGRVVAASGPWRSSGEWWREDGWESDEWDIEVQFEPGPPSNMKVTSVVTPAQAGVYVYPQELDSRFRGNDQGRLSTGRSDLSPACGPKPFGGRRPEGGFGPALRSVRAGRPQDEESRSGSGVKEGPQRGVYRVFYDLNREKWFLRGAYD